MNDVDGIDAGQVDELVHERHEIEAALTSGKHGDVEVAGARRPAGRTPEDSHRAQVVPLAELVELARLRCRAESGQSLRRGTHPVMVARGRPRPPRSAWASTTSSPCDPEAWTCSQGPTAGSAPSSPWSAPRCGAGFEVVSRLTWPEISIPQSTIPVSIGGRPYVIESDEFSSTANGSIGASRIIDISDETAPRVVSNLRLDVHMPDNRATVADDTSALIGGPYSGHFCSVPTRVEPGIVACSMLRSGVRVFDITDPLAPREVAYVSRPASQDCFTEGRGTSACLHTGSTVAFVPERSEMWISGQQSGFHVVRLTNGVFGSAPAAASPAAAPPAAAPPVSAPQAAAPVRSAAATTRRLPATGAAGGVLALATALLVGAAVLGRARP